MRKLLIIISLIIGIIFIADDCFKSKYQNPLNVAKAFSYSYMIKDSENMKSWADKRIYGKINKLQYSTPVDDSYRHWEFFELVSFRRLGYTIVCTYAYNDYKNLPLFYSVVLEPTGPSSLWERVKDFIFYKIPFGDKFIGLPHHKDRWLVVDFFTNDDFETYISDVSKRLEKIVKGEINWKSHIMEIKRRMNYENKWSDEEKIRQNAEMKELYMDYLKCTGAKRSFTTLTTEKVETS